MMALKTFLNLSEERQEELLMICFKEFALKGYDSTSLSEIIKKCGLAKGSFYRYFSSKKDLYKYLLEMAKEKRLKGLDKLIKNPKLDFFELVRENFLEKIKFELENPVIGGFLYKVLHETDNNDIADVIGEMYQSVIAQIQSLIEDQKYKTQIINLNSKFIAFQVFNMQLWLYDYVVTIFHLNCEENIQNGKAIITIDEKELIAIIDDAVYILKNGIGQKLKAKS